MSIPAEKKSKADVLLQLQREIMPLQGFKPASQKNNPIPLGTIDHAFPEKRFPLGAIHEFIAAGNEEAAASIGFMSVLLKGMMGADKTIVWIHKEASVFPAAMKHFDIPPHHVIFVRLQKEKEILWALEEALKCSALSAVVGEIPDISFTTSRRWQLAVEQSQVTGLMLRKSPKNINTTACIARWHIKPLPSIAVDDLPGIGFPQWEVNLLKIRNGKPSQWNVLCHDGGIQTIDVQKTESHTVHIHQPEIKTA